MNETIIVSLIAAVSGLLGVIVGTVVPWFRDSWNNKRQARYLAIRVVCVLDEFLEQCTGIVGDDGLFRGESNVEGCLEAQVSLPKGLPLPSDVDWRSIDHSLVYKILAFSNRIERDNRIIYFAADNSFPPDYDEFFDERQYRYACLGLDVIDLAQTLRTTYEIPAQTLGDWNPTSYLTDKKAGIEQEREERRKEIPIPPEIRAASNMPRNRNRKSLKAATD